jgi:anti-anti-sigma factor
MDRSAIEVIELAGEINGHVLDELSALIVALVDQHRRYVVVNLADLARVGEREVESLVDQAKQLRSMGGDLKIVGLNRAPRDRRSTTLFARFFEPYESLEAAVDGFDSESVPHMAPGP